MPATFFIATGYLGGSREFWWDELERIVFQSEGLPEGEKESRYRSIYERLQPMGHEARQQVLQMLSSCGEGNRGRKSHRTLAVEELQALARETAFEIGAHTVTHPVLAAQPIEVQYAELKDSRNWLEALLGRPVRSVSYPYGGSHHYTAATVEAVREIGFVRACTTRAGAVHRTDSPYEMARINVTDMDGEQFQKILNSV